ncbi:hypothetical protein AJ79_05286 [Helicocarpus griseus UAMH5409]|uniref:SAM-dependent MTase RsmB/NOP-type domain-containing protein n=1 Tax=Helicocarpus griseus UAMH5409 TaxID=1447875 RepID=A0A2B7XP29_9EURO|nr:hypothetical protein AJ79_05286 [Helicocarpus griseus UAMH5409]
MSLYLDAVFILAGGSGDGGSFKSRIYNSKLKSSPAQVYALITEASKWDILLKEVIENSGFLPLEPKLTPLLSILLVHDLLLSKRGIAAPANHHLRSTLEKHKSRIKAEFVKARVRRRCASVEELKSVIAKEKQPSGNGTPTAFVPPRWVRINNVVTTLDEELTTTFSSYKAVSSLLDLSSSGAQSYYRDAHIPDLLAVPQSAELTSSAAYKKGKIIIQDKASCFPAYLLLGSDATAEQCSGDLVDACAAPGNKTTHMASLLCSGSNAHDKASNQKRARIFSCDASQSRSKILQKMVSVAGAAELVSVLPGQDFLALSPDDKRFRNVKGLLLDPSCSGSGIVGRDDVPRLALPTVPEPQQRGKKRKRTAQATTDNGSKAASLDAKGSQKAEIDHDRLVKLSNLQSRIIEHAFSFPAATRVTYSTCSIHAQENEVVVSRVLKSPVAQRRGWKILPKNEQAEGLRKWKHRGVKPGESNDGGMESWQLTETEREACLRCWPSDEEGTGGFFVAGFVRDPSFGDNGGVIDTVAPDSGDGVGESNGDGDQSDEESEWEGFGSD